MNTKLPTRIQLETKLSQSIRSFYKEEIKSSPQEVVCKLFSRYLIVIVEQGLTSVEKSLWQEGETTLTQELSNEISSIIKFRLAQIIQEILQVDTTEILSDVTYQTDRLGVMAILAQPPLIREFQPLSKTPRS